MKLLTHPAVTALGIATLCLLPTSAPLISPRHLAIYHRTGEVWPVLAFAVLDFAVLTLLGALLIYVAEKPGRVRTVLWFGIIFGLPWVVMKNVARLVEWPVHRWLSMLVLGLLFAAFLIFSIRPSLQPLLERTREITVTILGFTAISGVIVIAQLIWCGWQVRNLNDPVHLHQRSETASAVSAKPRLIWILLDELSYQEVYEQRFPGLQLPAFDRLAAQSTIFTHTIPAGAYTEDVIPGLFTGRVIDRISVSSNGRSLYLHGRDSGQWQRFNQHDTIFQAALDAGYSTGVAGWYNPYCRILPQVLDRCFWTQRWPRISGIIPGASVAANLEDLWSELSADVKRHLLWWKRIPAEDPPAAAAHIADFRDISAAADSLIRDPSVNFVFLHLPAPHPAGIYNRKTGQFATSHSTYIDNLALADSYLANVREVAQQVGDWDSSTVIVMGDHSWRTQLLWEAEPNWTSEEQLASHGGEFDDRPAYIVKLPNQQQPARIDTPYEAVQTRALLHAILHNQIHSPNDLATWVQRQH